MRILQAGYGTIGKEVWKDYRESLVGDQYFVTDPRVPAPEGYEWDGKPVDVAVLLVDTPMKVPGSREGGFDYTDLRAAIAQYRELSDFILIRSTVGLDFLQDESYDPEIVGFSPEFYGVTKWSARSLLQLDFELFTRNVPGWFVDRVAVFGKRPVFGGPGEVILSKLGENAFLSMKVTFFHELALACRRLGLDFHEVRRMVTADNRIGPVNSFAEVPGWVSHCYDKDVPEYAKVVESGVIREVIRVNDEILLPARETWVS